MKTIHKYPLTAIARETVIQVPGTFKPLCVQMQNDTPALWAEVDPDSADMKLTVFMIGTGQPMPDETVIYVGTLQFFGGNIVWHIYVGKKFEPKVRQL